jgi:hypothetical protein
MAMSIRSLRAISDGDRHVLDGTAANDLCAERLTNIFAP